ncbi:MAG: hypothetical protein U9R19_13660, partial [Bacteroidota bacterium]|nr:hypothetical protein [Bacteroidota bacterium]
ENKDYITIDGFTIDGGNANNNPYALEGGGIYASNSDSLKLSNILLKNNFAWLTGGAIFLNYSSLEITNSTLNNNRSVNGFGGAIYSGYSTLQSSNCEFANNYCGAGAGGINFICGDVFNLLNTNFTGNYGHSGGAVKVYVCPNTNVLISSCNFNQNSSYTHGGAIECTGSNQSPPAQIDNCTFTNNSSTIGGALSINESSLNMSRLTFTSNSAYNAGAINYLGNSGTVNLNNSLFANNYASNGGGAFLIHGNVNWDMANNTIVNNSALIKGGAFYLQSSPNLFNNIIWGNTAPQGSQLFINLDSSEPEIHYCNIEGGYTDFAGTGSGVNYSFDYTNANNLDNDPQFTNVTTGNYSLTTVSPCLNVGTPTGTTGSILPYIEIGLGNNELFYNGGSLNIDTSDLGNNTRIYNGAIDLGAYELQELPQMSLSGVITNISCNNSNNGEIDITVIGGVTPYTCLWNDGSVLGDRTGFAPGTYSVTVTDAASTTVTGSWIITQPTALALSGIVTDVTVAGGSDGAIDLTVSGGTMPYTYLWSNGTVTEDISGLTAGFYDVTVTDSNGCIATETIEITEPGGLDVQNISLATGWGIMSTYIDPVYPQLDSVFSAVADSTAIVKNGSGLVYWPGFNLNMIGNMIIGQGYQVKMNVYELLAVSGTAVVPELTPIAVAGGWSIIGYLRNTPGDAVAMMTSIVADLTILKDGAGQVYWPGFNLNMIGNMLPGGGYQAKLTVASTL